MAAAMVGSGALRRGRCAACLHAGLQFKQGIACLPEAIARVMSLCCHSAPGVLAVLPAPVHAFCCADLLQQLQLSWDMLPCLLPHLPQR